MDVCARIRNGASIFAGKVPKHDAKNNLIYAVA